MRAAKITALVGLSAQLLLLDPSSAADSLKADQTPGRRVGRGNH